MKRFDCLAVRVLLWFVTLSLFPLPVTLWARSFQVEVLHARTSAPLPPERSTEQLPRSLTERVLARLEQFEAREPDPWMRDDIRIAWITALYASRENPQPHVAATYRVLGLHPDKVWPAILARREAILGRMVDLPHNKKQPMAESRRGNAPQKTCAYGAASDQRTGSSCRTATKREARWTLTSEFGLNDALPAGVAAPADKKPCASERRTRKRAAA